MIEFKVGDKVRCITSRDKDVGKIIDVHQNYLGISIYQVETKDFIFDFLQNTDLEFISKEGEI